MRKPAVFISSSSEGLPVARELGRQLETTAAVTLWSEGAFSPGKSAAESLTEVADRSDFAVFVLVADGASPARGSQWSSRSNVIFELGFLAGRLGLSRTFVVVDPERIRLPTDLAGTMYIPVSTSNLPDLEAAISPATAIIRRAMAEINTRQEKRSVQYHSCFISYSWNDRDFAARLNIDLQNVGVRSWLDAKDIEVGTKSREQIHKAIQEHDKVLLILSQASIQSSWVKLEVRNALRLERDRQKTVLFPIRLDDAVFAVLGIQEIDRLKEKYIGDFRDWHDKTLYQRAFSHLVRDLAISASVESERHS